MAETPITLTVDLAADLTVIRPGDTIIVRMSHDTPRDQLLAVAARLGERLPNVEVLMAAGVEGIDVYRPE